MNSGTSPSGCSAPLHGDQDAGQRRAVGKSVNGQSRAELPLRGRRSNHVVRRIIRLSRLEHTRFVHCQPTSGQTQDRRTDPRQPRPIYAPDLKSGSLGATRLGLALGTSSLTTKHLDSLAALVCVPRLIHSLGVVGRPVTNLRHEVIKAEPQRRELVVNPNGRCGCHGALDHAITFQ